MLCVPFPLPLPSSSASTAISSCPRDFALTQPTQQPLGTLDPQPQQQQRQRGWACGPAEAEGAGGRCAAKDASGLQRVHGQVCPPGKPEPPEEPCAERGEQPHHGEKGKAGCPGLAVLRVNSGLHTLALRAPLLYQALFQALGTQWWTTQMRAVLLGSWNSSLGDSEHRTSGADKV